MKRLYTVYTRKNLDKVNGQYINPVTSKGCFTTTDQAEALAEIIRNNGAHAEIGEFYIFTAQEWNEDPYKGKIDGKNSTIIAGKNGTTLIFEGLHFFIEGRRRA